MQLPKLVKLLVAGVAAGLATGGCFVLLALGCWYMLPGLRRLQTGHKERAISARRQTMTENTPATNESRRC